MLRGQITLSLPDIELLITSLQPAQDQELLMQKLLAAKHANFFPTQIEISEEDLEYMSDFLPLPSIENPQALSSRKIIYDALQKLRHL